MYLTSMLSLMVGLAATEPCLHGWLQYADSCYYFSGDKMDWVTAGSFCRVHHSELVDVETQNENDFIFSEIYKLQGGFWLGGSDSLTEGFWEWVATDAPFEFTNWQKGEPNNVNGGEDCVLMSSGYKNGEWNDGPCDTKMKFVCRRRQGNFPGIG